MRFLPQRREVLSFISPTMIVAGWMVTTGAVLTCMLWLGVEAHSAVANATLGPMSENFSPGAELAWWSGGAEGQTSGSIVIGDLQLNIEAYNKKREKEIADDSRKLLSLAIALKSDLEQDSGPAAVSKAKQIEKLAHDVKENMKLSIIGPH